MKTAIYIEDGVVQLVITPENDFEKNALKSFQESEIKAKIFSGSFYDCREGWVRQSSHYMTMWGDSNDRSLIIKVDTKERV